MPEESNPITRRKLIATGGALAAVGVAVGAAIPITASTIASSNDSPSGPIPTDQIMVHLADARSGRFYLFVGENRGEFTDTALAAKVVDAANRAQQ